MNSTHGQDRRTIPQRSTSWASRIADVLTALRLTPNSISVVSVLVAAVGAAALVFSASVDGGARVGLLVLAAVCLPLRLLLNMLDGMLAVERGMKTPTGDLFNELPDRIADLLVIAAAGYATAGVWMLGRDLGDAGAGGPVGGTVDVGVAIGWAAAALAILTAYVRTLGVANGVGNFFGGPMAKPPRMWVLVAAALLSILEGPLGWPKGIVFAVAVSVIALGSLATVWVRLNRIVAALRTGGTPAAGEPTYRTTPAEAGEQAAVGGQAAAGRQAPEGGRAAAGEPVERGER
ncbi:MAG TPA: CDP-alcohol phosphatidyltransferase family protein [Actinomycetales bacterium]|nr:CDP-alcohol phosphatidyltransferase family protein [Actinomycetales bacterium]